MPARTVLVADDEQPVLQLVRRMLERLDYVVLTACDGQAAVEVFEQHADEIGCVIVDLSMPRLDGAATCRAVRAIRPGVPVVVASGYGEDTASDRFGPGGASAFIQKPFRFDTLRSTLDALFA